VEAIKVAAAKDRGREELEKPRGVHQAKMLQEGILLPKEKGGSHEQWGTAAFIMSRPS
jgi:hypothetical protein